MDKNNTTFRKFIKKAQTPSHRALSFYDKNKSALLLSAILALIGGTGGALSGKNRKGRIWRSVLGALLGASAGAGAGHIYDKNSLSSRIRDKARTITQDEIKDAYRTLQNIQSSAQYDYMHRNSGKPATSLKELGNGWEIGSFGSNIDKEPVIARIDERDVPPNRYGFSDIESRSALGKPYRYGIVPFEWKNRTPVAIAIPEYDMDNGPGIIHVMPIKEDPKDFYRPLESLITKIDDPKGKAILRDMVLKKKSLTHELLEQLKK